MKKATRQDRLLKAFPDALIKSDGVIDICPKCIDKNITDCCGMECANCCKKYWLAEVEENDK